MSDDVPGGTPPVDDEPVDPQDLTPPPEDDDLDIGDDGVDPDALDEPEPIAAEPGAPPPKPPTRGQRDFQRLTNENRRQKQQLDQLTQQVQQLLGTQRQPSQAEIAEANRREQEQLEAMSPIEIARYYEQKTQRNVEALVRQAVAPIYDQNDRAEYERELERNPRLREFSDTVEDYKRQAPGVPRRMLLATALGMKALENQGRIASRAARNGAAQAAQHRTQAAGARADVSPARSRRGDDLEERLRGQLI